MQRWIYILAVFLGVQVLLAGGLMLRGDRLAPATADTPLVAADLKDVDRLAIDGPVSPQAAAAKANEAARIELVKRDGAWVMPAYFDAPADTKKIDAVVKQLADARRGLPVATTAQALDRFKVGEHDYERRIVASRGDKPLATVYLASAPGARKANARTAQDKAVYSVEMATYELPTGATEWLDRALLQHEASKVTSIEVSEGGKPALVLRRVEPVADRKDTPRSDDNTAEQKGPGNDPPLPAPTWSAAASSGVRHVDQARAAALVEAIANLRVDGVLGTQPRPEWQQEPPRLRLTITGTGAAAVTWTVTKPKAGDVHVLKASDRPWYFELKSWDAQPLLDAAATDKLVRAN